MINNFLKGIHKTTKIIVLISPILTWFILLIFKANPIYALNNFGEWGKRCFIYINENDLNHSANYTFIISIINIIGYMFAFSPSINISIKNKAMKNDITFLKNAANQNHKPSNFIANIDIDYKGVLWYNIIKLLGGIKIIIEPPSWAECSITNDPWDNSEFVVENLLDNLIIVDLEKAFEDNLVNFKGETIVGISFITNLQNYSQKPIKVKVDSKLDGAVREKILNLIINIALNISYKEHELRIETKEN